VLASRLNLAQAGVGVATDGDLGSVVLKE